MPSIDQAEEDEFRAKDDMRTLIRAEEIKTDSSRLKAAMAMAKKEMAALEKVSDG